MTTTKNQSKHQDPNTKIQIKNSKFKIQNSSKHHTSREMPRGGKAAFNKWRRQRNGLVRMVREMVRLCEAGGFKFESIVALAKRK